MKFAKVVFTMAGILGLLELVPLYFMYNVIGRQDPPPITHPGFYYGFVGTALAWQIAFLMIGRDPVRLRPVMIAAVVEKFSYSVAVFVLVAQSRMHGSDLPFGIQDFTLGILFLTAFVKTAQPAASLKAISAPAPDA
jgi:hypothetical protein